MNVPVSLFAVAETQLHFVLSRATPVARVILVVLALFSVFAWYMMVFKGLQMRRAKKLNQYFDSEFRAQKNVLGIFDRSLEVSGCPFFAVYQAGCLELDARLKSADSSSRHRTLTLKAMEHIKRTLESGVARESIKLESGLILLARPARGIARGQAAVLYAGEAVLGSATITDATMRPDWQLDA